MDDTGSDPSKGRRRFLATSARALIVTAGAGLVRPALALAQKVGVPMGTSAPKLRGFPFEELDGIITPTPKWFLRSHLEIPRIDATRHRIQIGGWVERPYTLTMAELQRMPQQTQVVTFECSGTAIGGDLMSTAEWTGPALAPIIERARPRKGGLELVMEGVDAGLDELVPVPVYYGRSIPMSMLPGMPGILALKMNGEPMRAEHGYPVRAILPGLYGTSHVKWVGRLTVITEPYMGFYQTQRYVGWYRVPEGIQIREILRQRVKSQFARIRPAPEAGRGVYRAVGAAWSGGEGIARVEVSTDAGRSWNRARVTEARGPYAWVVWTYDWVPAPGKHELVVRATDGRGRTQPMQRDDTNLTGYINNWCHRWAINVPA